MAATIRGVPTPPLLCGRARRLHRRHDGQREAAVQARAAAAPGPCRPRAARSKNLRQHRFAGQAHQQRPAPASGNASSPLSSVALCSGSCRSRNPGPEADSVICDPGGAATWALLHQECLDLGHDIFVVGATCMVRGSPCMCHEAIARRCPIQLAASRAHWRLKGPHVVYEPRPGLRRRLRMTAGFIVSTEITTPCAGRSRRPTVPDDRHHPRPSSSSTETSAATGTGWIHHRCPGWRRSSSTSCLARSTALRGLEELRPPSEMESGALTFTVDAHDDGAREIEADRTAIGGAWRGRILQILFGSAGRASPPMRCDHFSTNARLCRLTFRKGSRQSAAMVKKHAVIHAGGYLPRSSQNPVAAARTKMSDTRMREATSSSARCKAWRGLMASFSGWTRNVASGSHVTLYFGDRLTILRNPKDEPKAGTPHAMCKQLGIRKDDP